MRRRYDAPNDHRVGNVDAGAAGNVGVMMAGRDNHSATKRRDEIIVKLLGDLAGYRQLQPDELALMDRTWRRIKPRREVWRWHESDDRQILDLIHRRKRLGRPKPFQRNDEVRLLAEKLGRSYMAVHRRMERLRKREKCSDARDKRKE